MGAVCAPILGGNPLDEETLEKIKALVAEDLKEFSEKYIESYKAKFIAAVKESARKKVQDAVKSTVDETPDANKTLAPPRWYTAKQRPTKDSKKAPKKGKLSIPDAILRSGNLQVALKTSTTFFPKLVTVHGNYSLTIKKDEADKTSKPISFLYYKAEKDTEKEKTIKVYYVDEEEETDSEGAVKEEIVHRFQFEKDEDVNSWLEIFQEAATKGPAHLDEDPVKSESFLEAYNALRAKHGFAEDTKPLVGACELLGKIMVRIINKEILDEKYAEIKAPVEQCTPAFQDVFRATVGRMIGSAVRASYSTATSLINAAADKVRSTFESAVGKVYEVEQVVHDKIVAAVGSAAQSLGSLIEGAIANVIKPALQPLIDGLRDIVTKIKALIQKALSVINEDLSMDGIRAFFSNVRKQIAECITAFQDAIGALGKLIPIPEAVESIQDFCQGLADLVTIVFASLEHIVVDIVFPQAAAAVNKVAEDLKIVVENGKIKVESFVQVVTKTFNDTIKALVNDLKHIVNDFFSILLVPTAEQQWQNFVVEPVEKLGEELKSMVPEPVQEFVNIEEVVGTTLNDVWKAAITPILKPTTDLIYTTLDAVQAAAVAA